VRAPLACDIEAGFHLVEDLPQLIGWHLADQRIAIVAFDEALAAAGQAIQEARAFGIAKLGVRKPSGYHALIPRPMADGAIALAGERLQLYGAVSGQSLLNNRAEGCVP
jgi:hypothetical protein